MKLKKIIPVIVFVIAAVAVFNINTNKEKPMAITESLSSSPVFIEDVNINKEIATAYKRNLDSLPESMTQYATSITITTENLSEKFNLNLKDLSMGMSDDYLEAIKAGSTYVRLGRILWM